MGECKGNSLSVFGVTNLETMSFLNVKSKQGMFMYLLKPIPIRMYQEMLESQNTKAGQIERKYQGTLHHVTCQPFSENDPSSLSCRTKQAGPQ